MSPFAQSAKLGHFCAWFLKRDTTRAALRHALVGNSFTAARRRGKQIVLDTKDPDVRLGVHLGMSGSVLVDSVEAGDPLIYASNRRVPKWHRFGVHFADGGEFMVRDPRRLGAVELDPDESRLGPDALTLTYKGLDAALDARTAPIKAVLMDQRRIAGLGNLLADEVLFRSGIEPTRAAATIDPETRHQLHAAIRSAMRTLGRRGGSHTGDHMIARFPGALCPRDGATMLTATIGGRTTYWCSAHQR